MEDLTPVPTRLLYAIRLYTIFLVLGLLYSYFSNTR